MFKAAKPFKEALQSREVRSILPTEFRTDLLDTIPTALRERAVFSAGVVNAEFLQRVDDSVNDLLTGTVDRATKRVQLKQLLGSLGDDSIDNTDLTDLRSDARLNLILDTQLNQAFGYGHWQQGQQADILDQWPAQELIRVIYPKGGPKAERPWEDIWREAGGQFFGVRMIALKNDPIWTKISRFGTPYPPFDFNSGIDVVDVDRDTAIEAGLIDENTEIFPQSRDFNQELESSPEVRADWLRQGLEAALDGIARFDSSGVLKLIGGAS